MTLNHFFELDEIKGGYMKMKDIGTSDTRSVPLQSIQQDCPGK